MFYFELAISPIEAAVMVVGAFIIDRFFDYFMGDAEIISVPKIPKIDLSDLFPKRKPKTAPTPTVETIENEPKPSFDDLIKGR